MNKTYFAAIDLGATSGRTILGTVADQKVEFEIINRFPNHIVEVTGHHYWNLLSIYESIVEGLKTIAERGINLTSIGVDTWGVDFAFIAPDGQVMGNPYSYRDPHTEGAPAKFFERMPREELYKRTGIQIMNFNSVFQLDTLRRNGCSALQEENKVVFMPDVISYLLTGNIVTEYTIASTAQMIDPRTKQWDEKILETIGVEKSQFGEIVMPGTKVGVLSEEMQRLTGLGAVDVVAVAGHDTGSAVAAVPAKGKNFAYLSSGTWSLMGVETDEPIVTDESFAKNFTNEGGIEGSIRFLKNICGLWLLERSKAEWIEVSYPELIAMAQQAEPFKALINPDAPIFANPRSMIEAINTYCAETGQPQPQGMGEYVRCIFESLAMRYRQVGEMLRELSPVKIDKLYVIGGGSRNEMLNQLTANAMEIPVETGSAESTALGNIMVQAQAAGIVGGIDDMRQVIANSIDDAKQYVPQDAELWREGYAKYLSVYKEI